MSVTYQSIFKEGRRRLKDRGGLYAILAKSLKGVPVPVETFVFRPDDFTKTMEMQTNWLRGDQRVTMFAFVTPFLAFFCDSAGIYLFQTHEVRRVPIDGSFKVEFNRSHDTPVVIEGDIVFSFRYGSLTDQSVQEAVQRECTSDMVQTYLSMAEQQAGPTTLVECASFPVSYGCTACGKIVFDPRMLKRCSQCRVARYCNPECQAANWKEHKKTCRALALE